MCENEFGQPVGHPLPNWRPREWPAPIVLEGKHVRMEPLVPSQHASDLWAAYSVSDASHWTWLFAEYPGNEAGFLAYLESYCKRVDIVPYAIISQTTNKALGMMVYMSISLEFGDIEIGNVNLSEQLKRSRLSTEALFLLLKHAFDALQYRRVVWKCDALNAASRKAAVRYGFRFEGVFRRHMVRKGRSRDSAWYAMTEDEWPSIKSAFESWLDDSNFDADTGQQIKRLSDFMPVFPPSYELLPHPK